MWKREAEDSVAESCSLRRAQLGVARLEGGGGGHKSKNMGTL